METEFISSPMILNAYDKLLGRKFLLGVRGCIVIAGPNVIIAGCEFVSRHGEPYLYLAKNAKGYILQDNHFTVLSWKD